MLNIQSVELRSNNELIGFSAEVIVDGQVMVREYATQRTAAERKALRHYLLMVEDHDVAPPEVLRMSA
jgi:hypothetical protein